MKTILIPSEFSRVLFIAFVVIMAISCKKDNETETENILPVLSTAEVTDITKNTAICGGAITFDGGYTITAKGVVWNTEDNPTISNNKTNDGTGAGGFISNMTEFINTQTM